MKQTLKLSLLSLVAVLGACSDAPLAPRDRAPAVAANAAPPERPSTTLIRGDTNYFAFTIDPSRSNAYDLGGRGYVYIPAHATCDPARSTYGPTEWDTPCTRASLPIAVTGKAWLDAKGHPFVHFSPDLRFAVPSGDGRLTEWPTLFLQDAAAYADSRYSILSCSAPGQCVDEAKLDPRLATYRSDRINYVWRRIKHFSGYLVFADE